MISYLYSEMGLKRALYFKVLQHLKKKNDNSDPIWNWVILLLAFKYM